MTNSRRKGASFEREEANALTRAGIHARRGQQFRGGPDSPDIIFEHYPFHAELKRRKKHISIRQIYDWLDQCRREAGNKLAMLILRIDRHDSLVVMRRDDFAKVAACADYRELTQRTYSPADWRKVGAL